MSTVSAVLLAVAILALTGTVITLYVRSRRRMKELFGTANLKELIDIRNQEARDNPRSVTGSTELLLPRLSADFPELNYAELLAMAQEGLRAALKWKGFTDVLLHKTVLYAYNRKNGVCEAVFRSAVQYFNKGEKTQNRYSVVMGYVQDPDAAGPNRGISFNCPNCGAPISTLGAKSCPYCGSAVEPLVPRVWKVLRVEEV